jgi:hypothetical protein
MAIKKDITLEATGGTAGFHAVRVIALDLTAKTTMATLVSYVSEDTFTAGKQPASFQMITVSVDGLPDDAQAPLAFVEAQLVAPAPDGAPTVGNRYLFAGGDLVAQAAP